MPKATATKKARPRGKAKSSAVKKTGPRGKRGQNAVRDAEIVKLAKDGKTRAELAERFGLSSDAVHGVLWRASHAAGH